MVLTHKRTHVLIGFVNPHLICDECKQKVLYWHDPDRCGCTADSFNYPCDHKLGVISICPTWETIDGCSCDDRENHDKA